MTEKLDNVDLFFFCLLAARQRPPELYENTNSLSLSSLSCLLCIYSNPRVIAQLKVVGLALSARCCCRIHVGTEKTNWFVKSHHFVIEYEWGESNEIGSEQDNESSSLLGGHDRRTRATWKLLTIFLFLAISNIFPCFVSVIIFLIKN